MQPLLARFRQDAHNFLTHVPGPLDIASWYALMQHFGAPTPLLDWTESPYVAGYFAVEDKASFRRKRERDPHSAVWAVEADLVRSREGERVIQVRSSGFQRITRTQRTRRRENQSVNVSNPRLFAQQGVFLCKLFDEASFSQLLMTMMMHEELTTRPVIRRLEIGSSLRIKFLKNLRAMNIHRASLFPGLDGLAALLKLDLELKDRD